LALFAAKVYGVRGLWHSAEAKLSMNEKWLFLPGAVLCAMMALQAFRRNLRNQCDGIIHSRRKWKARRGVSRLYVLGLAVGWFDVIFFTLVAIVMMAYFLD
jgi:hypothetical protein